MEVQGSPESKIVRDSAAAIWSPADIVYIAILVKYRDIVSRYTISISWLLISIIKLFIVMLWRNQKNRQINRPITL